MAQNTMKDATTRQTQAKAQLQSIIDQAESASPDQVASEILALQNALQASYQVTSNLAQLSLAQLEWEVFFSPFFISLYYNF